MFSKSANPLDLPQKSTIRAIFEAKSVDPKTYSPPSSIKLMNMCLFLWNVAIASNHPTDDDLLNWFLQGHLRQISISFVFFHHWTQCIDWWYVRKGNDAKKPAVLKNRKNTIKCNACVIAIECGMTFPHSPEVALLLVSDSWSWPKGARPLGMRMAFLEIRLFLENSSLEFHEMRHENTLGNK